MRSSSFISRPWTTLSIRELWRTRRGEQSTGTTLVYTKGSACIYVGAGMLFPCSLLACERACACFASVSVSVGALSRVEEDEWGHGVF